MNHETPGSETTTVIPVSSARTISRVLVCVSFPGATQVGFNSVHAVGFYHTESEGFTTFKASKGQPILAGGEI
jgi:hypothetical protein